MGKSLATRIIDDLLTIGFRFRINDLNEVLEVKNGEGGWQEMSDVIDAKINLAMRNIGYGKGEKKPGITAMHEAILVLADRERYNPIKAYFNALEGRYTPDATGPYYNHQLARFITNPDGQFEDWFFKFKVGVIAKIYETERNPMLVLVGPQEIGKSRLTGWLCPLPECYLESGVPNPDDKDKKILVLETIIWEVGELESTLNRAEMGAFKAFITNRFERVRPPYGRRPIQKSIPASFVGTVNYNGAGFLNDPSGSTRYLACEVTHIDYEGYTKVCKVDDQWAEAWWYYKNMPGCWKLTADEKVKRNEINEKFEIVTGLEIAVEEHFTITGEDADFLHTSDMRRILVENGYRIGNENSFPSSLGAVLTKKGLKTARRRVSGKNLRGWVGIKTDRKGGGKF